MKFFSHGILGMNARNLRYIRMKNSAESISLADSKLKTKNFLSSRGIPFAETYATITSQQELKKFSFRVLNEKQFVIKPNKGSGGKGILIVTVDNGLFYIQNEVWTEDELKLHMTDILHGSFSLHGSSDIVVIEEKLTPGIDFSRFCKHGLADIRIIVYNYVPVTAMIRMPTLYSGGKANLAQGGVGLGLNIANGEVITLFQNKTVYTQVFPTEHTGIRGKRIPFWDDILLYSSQVQMYTKLGYLALDWVITKNGPKLLEINARAGLEIQNVNLVPLDARLRKIEDIKVLSPLKGVEIAKTLFHTEVISETLGKKVLFLEQRGYLNDIEITLHVDMSEDVSKISADIIALIDKNAIPVISTENRILISLGKYSPLSGDIRKVILGRNDLHDFLISPKLNSPIHGIHAQRKWLDGIVEFDELIYKTSKKVNLSSLLRPDNYFTILDEFIRTPSGYNPVFRYHFPEDDVLCSIEEQIKRLGEYCFTIQKHNPSLSFLYNEKLEEMSYKVSLVRAYKNEVFEDIFHYNTCLFGETRSDLFQKAKEMALNEINTIHSQDKKIVLGKILSLDEIIGYIDTYFIQHSIQKIPITIESGNLSRMSVSYGKTVKIHVSKNAIIHEKEIPAILSHEIGTHFRRYLNGKDFGLKIFQYGTGYYLSDEEGFAIYQSFKHLPDGYKKNAMYIKYYLLTMADTLSFSETVDLLRMFYPEKSNESIFSDAVRIKRGISHSHVKGIRGTVYQKDKIYLDGFERVRKWIELGGELDKLFYGKIKIQDIEIFETL